MSPLNIEKLVNAFIPNAIPSALVGGAALNAVNRFEKKHGGLCGSGAKLRQHRTACVSPRTD